MNPTHWVPENLPGAVRVVSESLNASRAPETATYNPPINQIDWVGHDLNYEIR